MTLIERMKIRSTPSDTLAHAQPILLHGGR